MKKRTVKVYAPASISNLGSGFDVIGIAIDRPGDYVTATRREEPGIVFSVDKRNDNLPVDCKENVAHHVASLMMDELKPPFGIKMILHKRMPIGSGLGSSAASSVASVVAVNALLTKPLRKAELLRFAIEGERKATGATHADNVAPSLFGGVCIVRHYDPVEVIPVKIKNTIFWGIICPKMVIKTREARSVLPESISLRRAVAQWGNVAGMIAGFITGDARLVGTCTEDVIVEPARAHLVPGFADVKKAALDAGALGCSLSGSGPSLFAVTGSERDARSVTRAMKKTLMEQTGIACDIFISKANLRGAIIVSRS
jgi:homoserine kinase